MIEMSKDTLYVRGEDGTFKPVNAFMQGGGASINDTTPSTTTTYSSEKIEAELSAQQEANAAQDKLITNKLDASALPTAINTALAQAKESGDFKGDPGAPGYTPQKGVDYFDGAPGHTPVKGTDYWTAEDKSGIVSDVLAALPNASGVTF